MEVAGREGGRVEIIGNGGRSEEDNNREVVEEEESSTTVGAVGEAKERWTYMSTVGRYGMGSDWGVEGDGASTSANGSTKVAGGGDHDCSASSSSWNGFLYDWNIRDKGPCSLGFLWCSFPLDSFPSI